MKALCWLIGVLVVMCVVALVTAQETEPPEIVPEEGAQAENEIVAIEFSPFLVSGGIIGSLHGMADLNQEIGYFNQDARVVAQILDDLYVINMSVSGRIPDLTMSIGGYGGLIYKPFPSIGGGLVVEYLQVATHGAVDISTPEVGVQFTLDVSIPTLGVLGVVVFDPSDLIDMGGWICQVQAGFGFYSTSAKSEKRIHLTGITDFTLRDEVDVSVTENTWGSTLSLSAGYQLTSNFVVKVALASRQLVFKNAGINFNNLADTVDLDLSGVCLSVGFELRF